MKANCNQEALQDLFINPGDQAQERIKFCPHLRQSCCSKLSNNVLEGTFGMVFGPRIERDAAQIDEIIDWSSEIVLQIEQQQIHKPFKQPKMTVECINKVQKMTLSKLSQIKSSFKLLKNDLKDQYDRVRDLYGRFLCMSCDQDFHWMFLNQQFPVVIFNKRVCDKFINEFLEFSYRLQFYLIQFVKELTDVGRCQLTGEVSQHFHIEHSSSVYTCYKKQDCLQYCYDAIGLESLDVFFIDKKKMRVLDQIIDSYWKDLRSYIEQKEYKNDKNQYHEQKMQAILDDQQMRKKISKLKFISYIKK